MQPNVPNPGGADPRLTPSASWLYWVAALSAINTVIQMSGGQWSFSLGLGVTQVLTMAADSLGAMAKTVSIAISAVVVILLATFGYMASRGAIWAFIAGIVVLGLDTLLLFLAPAEMWLSIAFHIWAVISLITGLNTARKIQSGTYTG